MTKPRVNSIGPLRLELPGCVVRDWARSDKAALVRCANNRKIWRNLTHMFPHPYTEAEADGWFDFLERTPQRSHWAIEVDRRAAGGIGVILGDGIYAKTGHFGYWLGEECWGRGIMTQVVKAVVPEVMSRFGLARLDSPVFSWNPASMRVLEKSGFVREGVSRSRVFKDGELVDEVLYGFVPGRP